MDWFVTLAIAIPAETGQATLAGILDALTAAAGEDGPVLDARLGERNVNITLAVDASDAPAAVRVAIRLVGRALGASASVVAVDVVPGGTRLPT